MSKMTLAGRKTPGNPHPYSLQPIGRPNGVTVAKVPAGIPSLGPSEVRLRRLDRGDRKFAELQLGAA